MHSPLTVYIDFKSPYAYLAIEPTRQLGRELGISIDWRPFVLDIPSYLGSARLNKSGEVAEASRSEEQWSGVKYAYYDCRRYANLCGMTIRGTVKIWDTNLAATGMLWAKAQGDDILQRYIDGIYNPFWRRALDVENIDVIEQVLAGAGAELAGFGIFAQGEGAQQNRELQETAFAQGVFGVPTYVLGEQRYFGREHLPRIRWQLAGARGPAPDIGYELLPGTAVEKTSLRQLNVGIVLNETETVLTIPRVLQLADETGVSVSWFALPDRRPGTCSDANDQSRGARHRRYRNDYRDLDRNRYLGGAVTSRDTARAVASVIEQYGITVQDDESGEGVAAAAYLGGPVFRLGDEVFVGRQHLPLIRARLQGAPSN